MLTRQHLFSDETELWLQGIMGVGWIVTYLIIIYKGNKDKSCGMPFAALCGNITWEFIYSFIFPHENRQIYIDYTWLVLDVIILLQFIKFSKMDLPKPLANKLFFPTLAASLAIAFMLHFTIALQFSDFEGAFSAFGLNFLMSLLFVRMALERNDLRGQSIFVAIFKLIGTVGASLLCYSLFPNSVLITFFAISTFFFDMLYVILLYQRTHKTQKGLFQ